MQPKLQLRIQRYGWDKASDLYEKYWQEQLRPAQDVLMEFSDVRSGEKILDVASGTGLITFRASEITGEKGHVTGIDISDNMIENSSKIAAEKNLTNVTFERMAAEEMDFPDESFDKVLCALGLMYVVEPLDSLKEFYRVLKQNGKCVSAVWGNRNNCGWAEIFPIVESRVKSDVCPMFFQLGSGDNLKFTYEQAGFKNVEVKKIDTILKYENEEDACGASFLGGPVAMAYSRFDDETSREAFKEYVDSINKYKKDGVFEIPGEFVIVSGEKIEKNKISLNEVNNLLNFMYN